jgi:hypothetical protein
MPGKGCQSHPAAPVPSRTGPLANAILSGRGLNDLYRDIALQAAIRLVCRDEKDHQLGWCRPGQPARQRAAVVKGKLRREYPRCIPLVSSGVSTTSTSSFLRN